ncbi:hypothetical protein KC365_g115 [Hortaea werneckii]|nr:hypothetical protein KC339_g110 [Hortaea werneckii]KAI7245796.1 hypothetical protein KC365_g115 [Hortaea werneckii]
MAGQARRHPLHLICWPSRCGHYSWRLASLAWRSKQYGVIVKVGIFRGSRSGCTRFAALVYAHVHWNAIVRLSGLSERSARDEDSLHSKALPDSVRKSRLTQLLHS